MSKVSVIVPVYNSNQYLRKCLNSICNQTLKDIEIICVNDNSSDNSLDILYEYASIDERIKIINLIKNSGAASTRNKGIECAKSEYIGFIDSDDFIDLDFYEKLYKSAKTNNSYIVKAQMVVLNDGGKKTVKNTNEKIKRNRVHFSREFTTAIYKTSFLKENNVLFPESALVFEDPIFLIKIYTLDKNIDLIDDTNYYYNIHSKSNMRTYTSKKAQSYLKSLKILFDIMNNSNITKNNYKMIVSIKYI